eukprot:1158102-Pelagomonas_calceolata.AAC.7
MSKRANTLQHLSKSKCCAKFEQESKQYAKFEQKSKCCAKFEQKSKHLAKRSTRGRTKGPPGLARDGNMKRGV